MKLKYKLTSIVLALIMTVTAVFPALGTAFALTWTGSRTMPSISGGVYQISTGEHLAWFAYSVNAGSTSIKGKLTADITLNDSNTYNSDGSYDNVWTPIGTTSHPFRGSFDGDGHTVSGVYIDSTDNNIGFFGTVDIPTPEDSGSDETTVTPTEIMIKNLNITSSIVKGNQNVGGIVGYGHRVGMENCTFNGTVNGGYNSVGGIIGWAYADSLISECYSAGTVNGQQRTGGIAGFASSSSIVKKSYSEADVTGTQNVGGIAGTLTGSSLEGCFFLGSVTAADRIGGIVGYSAFGTMNGAYAVSTVTSSGEEVGGAVGTSYGGEYNGIFYSYETAGYDGAQGAGRTVEEMKISRFVKELNAGGVYFCYDYTNINNGFPVLTWMLETDVWLGELSAPSTNSNGTYLITSAPELAWFSALVNGTLNGVAANPAANAIVQEDILLNISVYDDTYGINEWTPIGNQAHPYTGSFNGGGYNIAGVYTTSESGDSGKNVGLFGYVGSGSILNTVVIDGLICGVENVGAVAGYVSGGTINNCCGSSEVRGDKAVGGVVGNLASSTTTMTSCCMAGTINGSNYSNDKSYLQNVGGLVGYSNRATINKSFSFCKVNAPLARYTGGLVGNNAGGTVQNCYSISTVVGGATVGGFIGYNNNGTVTICYTVGKVKGAAAAGIMFGLTSGANVTKCYYDSSYVNAANTISGATGLTSAEMTGVTSLSTMNMSTSNWRTTYQDTYYFYYPMLVSTYYSSVKPIKANSLSSVRHVQSKFVARVEIDGRDNTYYQTVQEAINYAEGITSNALPIIYLVRDVEASATFNVTDSIGFFGDEGVILTRAASLTGPIFNVTGSLDLGSAKYGDENTVSLYIDGNEVEGAQSGIKVANGATLSIGDGIYMMDFRTAENSSSPVRGAVIENLGTLKISGGTFDSNTSRSVGGVVANTEGTVTVTGGTFSNNGATQGAAIYNDNGTVTATGGTFSRNTASLNGGAISTNGVYAVTTVTGETVMTGNTSTVGGALCVRGYGTLNVEGGTLTANTTYSTGGAIQIEPGSEAVITGGTIEGNLFYNNSTEHYGKAVYNGGTLSMGGSAQIDSNNDVYLPNGKTITVTERLLCSGYAATVTPSSYVEGRVVLDGDSMSVGYTKFGLSNETWHILANGAITSAETLTVAMLSKNNAYSVEYISLADAFAAVDADDTAIITVVNDSTISQTIPVNGDVTVVCDDDTYIASRSGSFYGVIFDVQPGATLRFGENILTPSQQAQSDYLSGTVSDGSFVLDGGYSANGVVGAAAVNVQQNGSFYMYDGAAIRNFCNTTTGTVVVSGTMHMFGGTITSNISCYGGGVYVKASGVLNTYGGVIYGNTSENGGSAVYSLGTVNRNIHTYTYWYIETEYDDDGNITGYKDAVEESSSKTDILIPSGEAVKLVLTPVCMAETDSEVYVRNLSQVPETTTFTPNNMTLDLDQYAVGKTVVTGSNVINEYVYFQMLKDGYFIITIGLNKIVAKDSSGLQIDKNAGLISGIDLDYATVGETAILFENDKTLLQFFSPSGTRLRNSNAITTGCYINLISTNGEVQDTVTIVVYGDVNRDFKIDGQDSVMISAIAAGKLSSQNTSAAQLRAADVNFDGSVTNIDAEHTDMSGLFLQTVSQS